MLAQDDARALLTIAEAFLELETVHRFADPAYAELSLLMRTGERSGEVFDELVSRGEVVVNPSEVELTAALTSVEGLVIADPREQIGALNAAIRDHRLATTGATSSTESITTAAGVRLGPGDRVTTRRNDRHLGVANRSTRHARLRTLSTSCAEPPWPDRA